jgi:NAD(P)H-flavin reductase
VTSIVPSEPINLSGKDDPLNKEKLPGEESEKEDENEETPPKKDYIPRGQHSEVPHHTSYVSGRHNQMQHIATCGPPALLDASRFTNWQDNMRSHINFASIESCRIIEQGYNLIAKDPNNLISW